MIFWISKSVYFKRAVVSCSNVERLSLDDSVSVAARSSRQGEGPVSKHLETSPNNLPTQLSSFIGRERAIAELKSLLSTTRLLTLTGAGGSGKTRLALQVATTLLADFEHGVWWVELASLTDPAFVPQQVASSLGLSEQPGRPLIDTLSEGLQSRSVQHPRRDDLARPFSGRAGCQSPPAHRRTGQVRGGSSFHRAGGVCVASLQTHTGQRTGTDAGLPSLRWSATGD